MKLIPLLAIPMLMCSGVVLSQEPNPDEEGCKDSQLVTRVPGCRISECEVKDFDSAEVITGIKDDEDVKKSLEGKVEILTYECPERISTLQVARNLENALRKAGYRIVFSGKAGSEPALTAQNGGPF